MAGTVARRDEGAVATFDYDTFPVLAEGVDALSDVLDANVGDEGIKLTDLTRVRFPTGGATAWEIPDDLTGEPETTRTIRGMLVHWQPSRVYWDPPAEGEPETTNEPPICSSVDGKVPVPGGAFGDDGEYAHRNLPVLVEGRGNVRTCEHCPMNQWGSHPKEGRKGKACKQQILLFVVREGETLPTIVSVPPTSLAVIRATMVKLSARYQMHFSQFVFDLSLEKITKGETYSKLVIRVAGLLDGARKGRQGPVEDSPAASALAFSHEFAKMLTPADVIEAAAGSGRETNGHVRTGASVDDVIPGGLADDDELGGDFAHQEEAALS
jgi:hypothetical protein